jgi:hypothetical protein
LLATSQWRSVRRNQSHPSRPWDQISDTFLEFSKSCGICICVWISGRDFGTMSRVPGFCRKKGSPSLKLTCVTHRTYLHSKNSRVSLIRTSLIRNFG